MSNLPVLPTAKLPGNYEDAKQYLAVCARIDECQDWADKAEALASYAKQADDTTLRKMADRIQARAIRRAGELLKEYDGRGRPAENNNGGDVISQMQAAQNAGMSQRQKETAVRVANVPEADFEGAIESDDPPTVTALAEQGTNHRAIDLKGRDPGDFRAATIYLGLMRRLREYTDNNHPEDVFAGLSDRETESFVVDIDIVISWLLRLRNMGET